jgi:hypothetical protein
LKDALADLYPKTKVFVGDDFFDAVAGAFITKTPPKSPLLFLYGAEFPDFLGQFPALNQVGYVRDIARMEWLRNIILHAHYSPGLAISDFAALDDATLLKSRCVFRDTLQLIASTFSLRHLWAAAENPDDVQLAQIDVQQPEMLVLRRQESVIDILPVDAAMFAFLCCLQDRNSIAAALQHAEKVAEQQGLAYQPSILLGQLISWGDVIKLYV